MNSKTKYTFTLEKLDDVKIILKNYKSKIKSMLDIFLTFLTPFRYIL